MENQSIHKTYLFIDESGDHGLSSIDPDFPVFVLCGIIISEENYQLINNRIIELKSKFWNQQKVILHSRDIRKCEKEFQILFDLEIKKQFYEQLNAIIADSNYSIIASVINKDLHIKKYGRIADDVYEIALSFLIESAVFCLDDVKETGKTLKIVIEKRGKKEDKKLTEHFQKILARGTGYINSDKLKAYNTAIEFKDKKDNINGLQLADLIAYPIARHMIDSERANPSFDIIKSKFYINNNNQYSINTYP